MSMRKSITAKFILTVFAVLVIGQGVGTFLYFFHMKQALVSSLESRMRRVVRMSAQFMSPSLLAMDTERMDAQLNELAADGDIRTIQLLDKGGKLIMEKVKDSSGEGQEANPFLRSEMMSLRATVLSEGLQIGDLLVGYSTESVNENMARTMTLIILYQTILIAVAGLVMVVLFNVLIKRPVSQINETIEKITLGDLTVVVPSPGDTEIGSITAGISFLSERLMMTVKKLLATATNVSMAIRQVDIMYQNVLEATTKQSNQIREMIKAVSQANKSQMEIMGSTEKLSAFSSENVSSLLEMKATAEEIAANTDRLFKATEDSYAVVLELTKASKVVAGNSQDIVSALEDTSASVEEVWASIKEVDEHAKDSAKLAETVREVTSDRGMLEVVNAVEGMDRISDEVMKSSEIIKRLGTRSADIEKVLSVIKDVTEQTNLLSLNAAILAAQAGEYGKSFSVVADEISALSERTASSTREIAGIVKTIQKDIKDAVFSIETARKKVEDGNGLVLLVGDALKEILTASERSTNMTRAIQKATEEQTIGLRQITSAIEDIRKMMNSVARSANEQDKALSHLLLGIGEVKEVADFSKRGTEEEAIGTKKISKNLELANERVAQISRAGMKQKDINDEIIVSMESINRLGLSTVKDMEDVSNSLKTLHEEIELLKKEMDIFRIK